MSSGNPSLARRDLLAGRTPRDFFTAADPGEAAGNGWPAGRFVPLLTDSAQMLDPGRDRDRALSQAAAAETAVKALAQLVVDLNSWMAQSRLTQQAVAARLGVSSARLARLRNGDSWPKWDLFALVAQQLQGHQRARIEREVRDALARQALAPQGRPQRRP